MLGEFIRGGQPNSTVDEHIQLSTNHVACKISSKICYSSLYFQCMLEYFRSYRIIIINYNLFEVNKLLTLCFYSLRKEKKNREEKEKERTKIS